MRIEPPEPPSPTPTLPARDAMSFQQVNTCISVLTALQPFLLITHREVESGIGKEFDGGAGHAAVATFCKACNRLDAILDDPARWGLDAHDDLYKSIINANASSIELHKQQIDGLRAMRRPSYHFKPEFALLTDGRFLAYYGDLMDEKSLIMGVGETPEEALEKFDLAWHQKSGEQTRVKLQPETTPDQTQPEDETNA